MTLKSRDGGLEKLPVKNPENLTGVMVGDEVTINATARRGRLRRPGQGSH